VRLLSFSIICLSNWSIDGRWVVDDYNEAKGLEEATNRGAQAGDLVGDLSDANPPAGLGGQLPTVDQRGERGPGLGMYRAGGPTTLFGGNGLGPYSDGPLNAVRKSYLTREGLDRENWMYMMARKVSNATVAWAKIRREGIAPEGEGVRIPKRERDVDVDGEKAEENTNKKSKGENEPTVAEGAYEPHSGHVLCKSIEIGILAVF
jgi:chromatin structure-remodeling complex protein RSC7